MAMEKSDMGLNLFWPVYIGRGIYLHDLNFIHLQLELRHVHIGVYTKLYWYGSTS